MEFHTIHFYLVLPKQLIIWQLLICLYLFIDAEKKMIIEELRSTIETNKLEWKGNKNEMNGRKYSWVLSSLAQEKRPTIVCRMLNTMATKKSYKQANQRCIGMCVYSVVWCVRVCVYRRTYQTDWVCWSSVIGIVCTHTTKILMDVCTIDRDMWCLCIGCCCCYK